MTAIEGAITPTPRQLDALECPAFELLFGGAKGGGKSEYLLMCWGYLLDAARKRWQETGVPQMQCRIVIFRKNLNDLKDLIIKSHRTIKAFDPRAEYNKNEKTWHFQCGATMEFAHLDGPDDHRGWNGNELCVTPESTVLMADGSWKRAGDVLKGDVVATIEGPREVLRAKINAPSPCVRARILDSAGRVLAEQVQTANHRVLSPCGWLSYDDLSRSPGTACREVPRSSSGGAQPLRSSAFRVGPSVPPLLSSAAPWSATDRETYAVAYSSASREASRPGARFVLAALGRPASVSRRTENAASATVGLALGSPPEGSFARTPSASRLDRESCAWPATLQESAGALPLQGVGLGGAGGCAPLGLHKASGFQGGYRLDARSGDEPLQAAPDTDPGRARSRAHVQAPSPSCWPAGAQDSTAQGNRPSAGTYVHPYTGRTHDLSCLASASLAPCVILPDDPSETVALTVAGASHYITGSIYLVNSNCGLGFDQVEELPEEAYTWLLGQVRTSDPYYKALCRVRSTANPGGIHGAWVKKRFIDPCPNGDEVIETDVKLSDGRMVKATRAFIRSALRDNPHLNADGDYEARLRSLPEHLVKMWLDGDWDAVDGAFFASRIQPHIHSMTWAQFLERSPDGIPTSWEIGGGLDWGSSAPAAWLLCARDSDDRIWVFDELYCPGDTGRAYGEKMRRLVANQRWNRTHRWNADDFYTMVDSEAWARFGADGAAPADTISSMGFRLFPANKDRRAGIEQYMDRLQVRRDGLPGIVVIRDRCPNFWRTFGAVRIDKKNPEDYDMRDEAHAVDAVRFRLMDWPVRLHAPLPAVDAEMQRWDRLITQARQRQHGAEGYES